MKTCIHSPLTVIPLHGSIPIFMLTDISGIMCCYSGLIASRLNQVRSAIAIASSNFRVQDLRACMKKLRRS